MGGGGWTMIGGMIFGGIFDNYDFSYFSSSSSFLI
jgi:hypothetical protein